MIVLCLFGFVDCFCFVLLKALFALVFQMKERKFCLKISKRDSAQHDMLLAAKCVLLSDFSFIAGVGLPNIASFSVLYRHGQTQSPLKVLRKLLGSHHKEGTILVSSTAKLPLAGWLRSLIMIYLTFPIKITSQEAFSSVSSAAK